VDGSSRRSRGVEREKKGNEKFLLRVKSRHSKTKKMSSLAEKIVPAKKKKKKRDRMGMARGKREIGTVLEKRPQSQSSTFPTLVKSWRGGGHDNRTTVGVV